MHPVCSGDCNSEKTRGKFVRLNRREQTPRLDQLCLVFRGWVIINQLDKMAGKKKQQQKKNTSLNRRRASITRRLQIHARSTGLSLK